MTSARSAGLISRLVERHRLGQEPALGPDLHELQGGPARSPLGVLRDQLEDQEPPVAPGEHAEAVAPRLDVQRGPGVAVDQHRVAEELGVPDRRDVAVRDVGALEPVEEGPAVGVEERAVRVERPVLDGQRDLE